MTRIPKLLQLSDDDLRAIGEVAAQWSLANVILEILLFLLTSGNPKTDHFTKKRFTGFDTKADACKTALKTCFNDYPLLQEIGLALMSRGKELSTERNITLHWPASRVPGAIALQFADLNFLAGPTMRNWTVPKLLALSDAIADWTMDIGHFKLHLILNGPLALHTTWHGPRIDTETLQWESFRSVRKDTGRKAPRSPKPQTD